jgi:hypothetical protein
MKGRASFSAEIDKSANYIAKRFADIGLSPLKQNVEGNNAFLQPFNVYQITPNKVNLTLNSQKIADENIAFVATVENVLWQQKSDTQITVVNENDNLSAILSNLNKQGGQHLVLVNTKLAPLFKRYQQYFKQGSTKISIDAPSTLAMVLTDEITVDNVNLSTHLTIRKQKLQNVVGVLPAKIASDEYVVFSGHYDHLGINPSLSGDQIYNGADDDASGTTAVMNLAQYYKSQGDNKRNIIFVAFTAEEIGGFGSAYFSQQLNADKIVAMFNIEMIGKPSKFGVGKVWMTGADRSTLQQLMNQHLADQQLQIYTDPYPKERLFYRSDNATLARLGVPAHSFSSTQLDQDKFYHQVTDDISTINQDSMLTVIKTIAKGATPIVQGIATPSRIDKAKVHAKGIIF